MRGFWSRCHCKLPTLALRLSPGRPPADLRPPVHSPVLSPWSPSRREDLLTLGRGLCAAAAAVTEPGRAYLGPRRLRVSVAGYAHVRGLGEQPLLSRAPIFSPTRPGGSHSVRCQALVRPPHPRPQAGHSLRLKGSTCHHPCPCQWLVTPSVHGWVPKAGEGRPCTLIRLFPVNFS